MFTFGYKNKTRTLQQKSKNNVQYDLFQVFFPRNYENINIFYCIFQQGNVSLGAEV